MLLTDSYRPTAHWLIGLMVIFAISINKLDGYTIEKGIWTIKQCDDELKLNGLMVLISFSTSKKNEKLNKWEQNLIYLTTILFLIYQRH